MTAKKDVHIGHEIKRVLHDSGMSVTEFAASICCNRKNVYDIFRRKSLQIDHIIRISEVLNYDFIRNCYYDDDQPRPDYSLKFNILINDGDIQIERCNN